MAWTDGMAPEDLSYLGSKGWDKLDDVTAAKAILGSYRGIEKLHGDIQAGNHLSLSDATHADPAKRAAFWAKLGTPADGTGYKFEGLKTSDGRELDTGLLDAARKAGHEAGIPADMLHKFIGGLIPWMESDEQADVAAEQAKQLESRNQLDQEWGPNALNFKYIATRAMDAVKAATGLDLTPAIAALEKTDGVGYAAVHKMFKALGDMMGEGRFIPGGLGGGANGALTPDSAKAQLDSLMRDEGWVKRVLSGDTQALEQRRNLFTIISGGR